ncbi:MAG: hypothetical protein E7370_03580 [Clostridiales bacterium]|nr:hypothetical protein [Clostridiales bacterium]
MDNDKRVIVVNEEDKGFYFKTAFFGGIFSILAIICGMSVSPWAYLLILIPVGLAGLCVWSHISIKNRKEETEFTSLGIISRVNGEVVGVYSWDCFGGFFSDQKLYEKLNSKAKFKVTFIMQAINEQGYYTNEYVSFITNTDTLYKIQEVAPLVLFERRYLTEKRKGELAKIELNFIKYQNDPLQKISIRGRIAYLILCIETVILHYGEALEKDAQIVELLWKFTSAFLDEERLGEFQASVAEYKKEYEAFPDFAPTSLENLISLQRWVNDFNEAYNSYSVEENNEKSKLIYRLLTAVKSVAWYLPFNQDYAYDTAMSYKTLEEIERVNEILVNAGISLPEIKFIPEIHSYSQFFLACRTEDFGIGRAFNGAKTYSLILRQEPTEDSDGINKHFDQAYDEETTANEQIIEASPDAVYRVVEQLVAPTVNEDAFNKRNYRLISWQKTPLLTVVLIFGLIFSVAAIATYFLYFNFHAEILQVFTIILAPAGGVMLNMYFSIKKREQEDRDYPFKALDLIFALALCGVHIFGVFYTFYNYGSNVINPVYLIEFTLFASVYAAQFVTLLLTSQNKKFDADYFDLTHTEDKKKVKVGVHQVKFEIAEIVIALALAIASLVCLIIFNATHGVVEGVLCILFSLIASLIINCTVMVMQGVRRSPKKQKITATLILLALFALSIISLFLTASLIANKPIDWFVPLSLLAIAVYRLVLLIMALMRYNKNTAI